MEAPILIPPDDTPVLNPSLGGVIETPAAFVLLTGRYEDMKTSSVSEINIPVTTLPAILGRTHPSSDSNTYDLGNCKQLSRKHAVIYYCDKHGNKVESLSSSPMTSRSNEFRIDNDLICKPSMSDSELNLIRNEGVEIPPNGCYVIECLSKNKIHVNGKRVEQGQRALLTQGSKIKILTYTIYFLLPLTEETPKVFSLPHSVQTPSVGDNNDDESIMSGSVSVEPSSKKRKKEANTDFSDRPLSELLSEFFEAVDNNALERKHSFISTAILSHAINDACADPKLIDKCKNEGGLQRAEVIEWIENHEVYGRYTRGLLKHVEVRTYHQNLSRAMSKVGFERVGTSGRHVKWLIPGIKAEIKKEPSKSIDLNEKNTAVHNTEQGNTQDDDKNTVKTDGLKLATKDTEDIEMQSNPDKNVSPKAAQEYSPPDQSSKDNENTEQVVLQNQQDLPMSAGNQPEQQPNQDHGSQ